MSGVLPSPSANGHHAPTALAAPPPAARTGARLPWSAPLAGDDPGVLDAVGVGIGPFNLSAAALLHPHAELRTVFLERAPELRWHPGLLLPDATIQVSFLKDLVTLADPTSPFSFLAFLHAHRRLYRFINCGFPRVTRREFEQYLRWVADGLPSLRFGRQVDEVRLEDDGLVVCSAGERLRTRAVILGTGLSPRVPACARPHLGPGVFHGYRFLEHAGSLAGRRVAVVGGGQTGAEVVEHLLNAGADRPASLAWVSRRPNFLPLDESPFTNEMFTPGYADHFFGLDGAERARLLEEQKLASDGVSGELLERIYRRLYVAEFVEGRAGACTLHPGRELVGMDPRGGGWALALAAGPGPGAPAEVLHADVVVLCTGAEYRIPPCLAPLQARIDRAGDQLAVRDDFSLQWDAPADARIYVQNAARHRRGVADPNLSLMAWRSAVIVNSLAGRTVYDVSEPAPLVRWAPGTPSFNGGPYDEQHRHGAGAPAPA
jgi:lysine N6-hydroxylase